MQLSINHWPKLISHGICLLLGICMAKGQSNQATVEEQVNPLSLKRGEGFLSIPSSWLKTDIKNRKKLKAFGLVVGIANTKPCTISKEPIFLMKARSKLIARIKTKEVGQIAQCLTTPKFRCVLKPLPDAIKLPNCKNKPRIIYGLQS